ncbi:hypothetical protein AX14_003832 [Amanita brunnescens Koide BX004]|nr:hypothetical protein AX14_003832 [Amanita brunnescens Koide BX004]
MTWFKIQCAEDDMSACDPGTPAPLPYYFGATTTGSETGERLIHTARLCNRLLQSFEIRLVNFNSGRSTPPGRSCLDRDNGHSRICSIAMQGWKDAPLLQHLALPPSLSLRAIPILTLPLIRLYFHCGRAATHPPPQVLPRPLPRHHRHRVVIKQHYSIDKSDQNWSRSTCPPLEEHLHGRRQAAIRHSSRTVFRRPVPGRRRRMKRQVRALTA